MSNEEVYSNKDSNRNRIIEEKESIQRITFVAFFAILAMVVFAIYYYQIRPYQATPKLSQINPIAPLPKKDAPIESYTKSNDEAKPYDLSKPPYEQ